MNKTSPFSNKVSVVIRNKNQKPSLSFLLENLNRRYSEDIEEIIVLDNASVDGSQTIVSRFGAKLININDFGYGSSANRGAEAATSSIVVIFSAHAYPVSHDFFKLIIEEFRQTDNLAGLRCLHNHNDYKNYILNISAEDDTRQSGLIFCGSAFNREVWKKIPFNSEIVTMEDKEWSLRVLHGGYQIKFVPAIFCYHITRTRNQKFIRYKNETYGSYRLWGERFNLMNVLNGFFMRFYRLFQNTTLEAFYIVKTFVFQLKFLIKK